MLSIVGTYQNGYVKLNKEYVTNTPVNVIVTFIEDIESTSESGISPAEQARMLMTEYGKQGLRTLDSI